MQFFVQNRFVSDQAFIVSVTVGIGVLILLFITTAKDWRYAGIPVQERVSGVKRRDIVILAIAVFIMSLVIGLKDGIITALHAHDELDIAAYPRLFYV